MIFKIQELEIYDDTNLFRKKVGATNGMENLFLRTLNKTPFVEKKYGIRIFITKNEKKHLVVSELFEGIIPIDYCPNLKSYEKVNSDYDIKKFWLDVIYESVISIGKLYKWPIESINRCYSDCIDLGLENQWFFKGKLIRSPGKKYHVGVLNVFLIEGFESYLVLFDKYKKEIVKNLIYRDESDLFTVKSLKWISENEVCFQFDGPKKEFVYSTEMMKEKELPPIPEKIHLLFK